MARAGRLVRSTVRHRSGKRGRLLSKLAIDNELTNVPHPWPALSVWGIGA